MNYQTLYASVIDYMARDDISESLFDTWLRLTETRLKSKLDLNTAYTEYTGTLSDGEMVIPSDYLQGLVTRVVGTNMVLQYKQPQLFEETNNTGGFFTVKNNTLLVSGILGDVDIKLEYFRKIRPLSKTIPENIITDDYPELYLYGALREGYVWAKDIETEAKFAGLFEEALTSANLQSVKKSISGSQLQARPDITE